MFTERRIIFTQEVSNILAFVSWQPVARWNSYFEAFSIVQQFLRNETCVVLPAKLAESKNDGGAVMFFLVAMNQIGKKTTE
jgi:hypothetical protein